jgi:hypothetical protein
VHIEPELEQGPVGIDDGRGQGLAGRQH